MDEKLESRLRRTRLSVLDVLRYICINGPCTIEELGDTSKTKGVVSGVRRIVGVVSTLSRGKQFNGDEVEEVDRLIIPAGRKNGILRWDINERVISRDKLLRFLDEKIYG